MEAKQTRFPYNQKVYYGTDKIEKVSETVIIQTKTNLITGDIYLRPVNRLIDEMNECEKFLAVTDAVVYERSGKVCFKTKFLTISAEHIVYIIPKEDLINVESPRSQENQDNMSNIKS